MCVLLLRWAHPAKFLVLQSQDPGALSEELYFDRWQWVSRGEVTLSPPPEKHLNHNVQKHFHLENKGQQWAKRTYMDF